MNTCIVLCAGGFDRLPVEADASDCVLAADGGYAHARALGLTPNEIMGDFDSLGYVPEHARVFPVEKDDTDSMLAARRGLELGFRRFVFYGALDGPRLDHTVANLQVLRFLAEHGAQGYLVGLRQTATAVRNGELRFDAGSKGILSLFCMGPDARGVTLAGLKYPLEDGTLSGSFPLGVSNAFTGCPASVQVKEGCLLAIFDRENGLPEAR